MPVLPRLTSFFRTLTRGGRLDAELDAELRAYVDLLTEEKIAAGLAPEAARRAALVEVGGVEQVKERVRDVRIGVWLETVGQDIRYAVRGFRRSPWFTATAVASLALGIGLNASIFSAIQAVLLRGLPFADPNRVVEIRQLYKGGNWGGVSPAAYLEWERRNGVFERMGAYDGVNDDAIVRSGNLTRRVSVMRVNSGFFSVLGRPPALGRLFGAGDDVPGAHVAILSDDWWRAQYGADPGVLGRTLTIDNTPYEVVGIMPPGFQFYRSPDYRSVSDTTAVWVEDPFAYNARDDEYRDTLGVIARLKPEVSAGQASEALTVLAGAARRQPEWFDRMAATPIREILSAPSRRSLLLCAAIAAFLLVLAICNLAALSLARADSRRSEFEVRAAVGAARRRIVRQVLTESLLLGGAAGVAGVGLASWAGALLHRLLPGAGTMARLGEARLTWTLALLTMGMAMLAALAAGAGPAWLGSRSDLRAAHGLRLPGTGRAGARVRRGFVLAQLSISLIVLSATALLLGTVVREQRVPLGFDAGHLLTLNVRYPRTAPYVTSLGVRPLQRWGDTGSNPQDAPVALAPHYALTAYGASLPDRLAERLRVVPGVRAAAVASMMPFRRSIEDGFTVEGRPVPPAEAEGVWAVDCAVTPGFFETFGMKLLSGRGLTPGDGLGARRVMVVNATLARDFLGGVSRAVGHRVIVNGAPGRFDAYDVVGVVSDVRFWTRPNPGPQMFTAYAQAVEPAYTDIALRWRLDYWIAVQTTDNGAATVAAITQAIESTDHGAPVESADFLSTVVARGSGDPESLLALLMFGAGVAVLLAAVGIFGTTAFTVSQQTHEIGVRVTLGASPRTIMTDVLMGSGRLALGGVLIGAIGAYWTNQLFVEELFEVKPTDPGMFIAATTTLVLVVLVATWLPARRAAGVDPVVALRTE